MKPIFAYGGWVIAAVAVAACAFMYFSGGVGSKAAPEPDAAAKGPATASDTSAVKTELDAVKAEAADLRSNLAKVQAELAERDTKLEELAKQQEKPAPAPEEAATDEADTSEAPDAEEAGPSRGERIVNAQLTMMADMTYRSLFDELGLTAEVRGPLNEIIGSHMAEAQKVAQGAMQSKDQKAKDVHARLEAMKADLRAELAQTLNDDGLAAWDAYDPVADQMLYERLVDGQLNMMASGLTEENRVLSSQVMAEELVREFDVFNQSDELYTLDNYNNAQARALNASLERLSAALPQDQYDSVNGFVNHAIAMFNAMAEQQPPPQ